MKCILELVSGLDKQFVGMSPDTDFHHQAILAKKCVHHHCGNKILRSLGDS